MTLSVAKLGETLPTDELYGGRFVVSPAVQGLEFKTGDFFLGGTWALLLSLNVYKFINLMKQDCEPSPWMVDRDERVNLRCRQVVAGSSVIALAGSTLNWLEKVRLVTLASKVSATFFSVTTGAYLVKHVWDLIENCETFKQINLFKKRVEPFLGVRKWSPHEGVGVKEFLLGSTKSLSRKALIDNFLFIGANISFACWTVAAMISCLTGALFASALVGLFVTTSLICFGAFIIGKIPDFVMILNQLSKEESTIKQDYSRYLVGRQPALLVP